MVKGNLFCSYVRSYHAYKDMRNPIVGNDSLFCEKREGNEYVVNAVAVGHESLMEKKVVTHIAKLLGKTRSMFLSLLKDRITREIPGKRLNRGAGYGLEIPCICKLCGDL